MKKKKSLDVGGADKVQRNNNIIELDSSAALTGRTRQAYTASITLYLVIPLAQAVSGVCKGAILHALGL